MKSPVAGQTFSQSTASKPKEAKSEEIQREKRLRSLLKNKAELKFTSFDVKTYHPRSTEEQCPPKSGDRRVIKLDKLSEKIRESSDSKFTKREQDVQKTTEPHGTMHFKAILKEQAKTKRGTNGAGKQVDGKGTLRGTTLNPINRQAQGRFAFLKNIQPSKRDDALRFAKPLAVSVPGTPSEIAKLRQSLPNKALHMRLETKWKNKEHLNQSSVIGNAVDSGVLNIGNILKSARRANHRDPVWLVSMVITSSVIFLFLTLAMCMCIDTALMISLVPLIEKIVEVLLKKTFWKGQETEDESASRDFLEKLICEVEARTKAKIGKRRFMDVPYGKS